MSLYTKIVSHLLNAGVKPFIPKMKYKTRGLNIPKETGLNIWHYYSRKPRKILTTFYGTEISTILKLHEQFNKSTTKLSATSFLQIELQSLHPWKINSLAVIFSRQVKLSPITWWNWQHFTTRWTSLSGFEIFFELGRPLDNHFSTYRCII